MPDTTTSLDQLRAALREASRRVPVTVPPHQEEVPAVEGAVDFVEEIRLRSWARQHYTQPENRSDAWHPIVLEEMQSRDRELQTETVDDTTAIAFVPLVPTDQHRVDPGHTELRGPNVNLAASTGGEREERFASSDYAE